jgi:2-desacetyl-2-hydroxyethyl bacteriochlorophyllide A dehydrogenase
MRAIVIDRFGDPEVLQEQNVSVPMPGPEEILLDVTACGVCFHDVLSRKGAMRKGMELPLIPGHEIAGVVAEVGPLVRDFSPGDRVATTQRRYVCGICEFCRSGRESLCPYKQFLGHECDGGYAEQVVVSAGTCARIPDGVADIDAAIAACAIGTGLNALRDVGKVRIGETVLISGAGGGLGVHVVQLASRAGARVVATTTSPAKENRLKQLGADVVVVSQDGIFSEGVLEATAGRGVDLVIDNVGGKVFDQVRRSLAKGGRWVMVGELSSDLVQLNLAQLFLRGLSLHSAVSTSRAQLVDTLGLIASGHIRPIVREAPLQQAAQVHAELETGAVLGRVALSTNKG